MPDLETLNRGDLTGTRLILCEGNSDAHFLHALIADRGIPEYGFGWPTKDEHDASGVTGYFKYLNGLRLKGGFAAIDRLLIVADNDDKAATQLALVRKQIGDAKFPVPAGPSSVAVDGHLQVGIFMFPEAVKAGSMETLVLDAWSPTKPQRECVEAFETCTGISTWATSKRSKALIRCILASTFKKEPERSLAYVWGGPDNPFDIKHACFNALADELRKFA